MQYLFLAVILLILSGCTAAKQTEVEKSSSYTIGSDSINLKDPKKQRRFDGCVLNAYTIKDSDIFIEYLKLSPRCSWNGLGSSFFRNLLNQTYSLSVLQSFKAKDYHIVVYKMEDKRLYFLSRTYRGGNYFIIDYSGEFTQKICSKCSLITKKEQFSKRFDKSLVKNNILNNYFSTQSSEKKLPLILQE